MFLLSNNQQGGTILLLTVLMITATLVVTLTASDIIRTGILISRERHDSTKAYFAAEAGAERILWELRYNGMNPGAGGLNCNPLGDYFCFDDTSGDIVSCNDPCPGGEIASTTLDNNAFYTIWYEFEQSGINSTTTLSSTGVFRNVGRKVELLY